MSQRINVGALLLSISALGVGCQRSGDSSTTGDVTIEALPPAVNVWCPVKDTKVAELEPWMAQSDKVNGSVSIYEGGAYLSEGNFLFIQNVSTGGMDVSGVAVASANATETAPALYVLGRDQSTDEALIRMHPTGTSTTPIGNLQSTLRLPAGQTVVAMVQASSDRWWAATAGRGGRLRLYKLIDSDFDEAPDSYALFANLRNFENWYPTVIERLQIAPFNLVDGDTPDEVFLSQEGSLLFRIVDSDFDGQADQAFFPFRGVSRGFDIADGATPGSSEVLVRGYPGAAVEVWSTDGQGVGITLLGRGTIDDDSKAIIGVFPTLQLGQYVGCYYPAADVWGAELTVDESDGPMAVRLTDLYVSPGDLVDVFIPAGSLGSLRVNWVYINVNDWPYTSQVACPVADLGSGSFRVAIPATVSNHHPGFQHLEIIHSGFQAPAHVEINVENPDFDWDS